MDVHIFFIKCNPNHQIYLDLMLKEKEDVSIQQLEEKVRIPRWKRYNKKKDHNVNLTHFH